MNLLRNFAFLLILYGPLDGLAQGLDSGDITSSERIHYQEKVGDAFQGGEWFRFRIHYGIFNASFATLSVKDTIYQGKAAYHASGVGRTTGLARLFFRVDDYYDSIFEQDIVRPLYFIRNINEGGYTKHVTIEFDHPQRVCTVNNLKTSASDVVPIKPNVQDLISAFYFLRNHFDLNDIQIGEFAAINIFYDLSNFVFKFKFLGKEKLNTKFGVVSCLKFRPYVESGRVFNKEEGLTLWISDDENKMPIRLTADLRVGSIDADLDAFRGLKHPFKIIVNE
ncbi:MAG: DUF3108 domain-containing protein [Flavobacteriaceae bacterium]